MGAAEIVVDEEGGAGGCGWEERARRWAYASSPEASSGGGCGADVVGGEAGGGGTAAYAGGGANWSGRLLVWKRKTAVYIGCWGVAHCLGARRLSRLPHPTTGRSPALCPCGAGTATPSTRAPRRLSRRCAGTRRRWSVATGRRCRPSPSPSAVAAAAASSWPCVRRAGASRRCRTAIRRLRWRPSLRAWFWRRRARMKEEAEEELVPE